MKKFFAIMLMLLPLAFCMTSCGDDDDEPGNGGGNNTSLKYTGTSTYRYPLFYWDKSKSYIQSKENLELYQNQDESLTYKGAGNVTLEMYFFTNNKLTSAGMAVESSYGSACLRVIHNDFEDIGESDGQTVFLSKDGSIMGGYSYYQDALIVVFLPNPNVGRAADNAAVSEAIAKVAAQL